MKIRLKYCFLALCVGICTVLWIASNNRVLCLRVFYANKTSSAFFGAVDGRLVIELRDRLLPAETRGEAFRVYNEPYTMLGRWSYSDTPKFDRSSITPAFVWVGVMCRKTDGYFKLKVPFSILTGIICSLGSIPIAVRMLRRRRARKKRLCLGCGYDLRCSPEHCPECGRPVDSRALLGDLPAPRHA
jgi:hypothetical protein